MAVLIKKYRVRYNGEMYGPGQPGGQVLEGLSEKEEARLIDTSNGAIEKYKPLKSQQVDPDGDEGENAGGGSNEGDPKFGTGNKNEDILGDFNPDDFIKPGNPNKTGKSQGK